MQLLVTGGSGFVGRHVCRRAVAAGHEVASVARSGPPATEHREPGDGEIEWIRADVFEPHEWREHFRGVDAVVHSVGIARENPAEGATFERVNGDAAILAALEAERAGVDRFVFVSSSAPVPGQRRAYLHAKRRAERAIADLDVETVVLRPGPVYGRGQPHFPLAVDRTFALLDDSEACASRLGRLRPLPVATVARAIVEAAVAEEPFDGPVGPDAIAERFGSN